MIVISLLFAGIFAWLYWGRMMAYQKDKRRVDLVLSILHGLIAGLWMFQFFSLVLP